MIKYNYDDIYGIGIGEYLKIHNQTLEDLTDKIKLDIKILNANLGAVLNAKLPYPESHLSTVIHNAISKKEVHLNRLYDWERDTKTWD